MTIHAGYDRSDSEQSLSVTAGRQVVNFVLNYANLSIGRKGDNLPSHYIYTACICAMLSNLGHVVIPQGM